MEVILAKRKDQKIWLNYIKLSFYLVVPIILLVLPSSFFDHGQSLCLSVVLLDTECHGCGITRAIMHLIHFEFQQAYTYNALSFVVFPVGAFVWVGWFRQELKKLKKKQG